MRILILHASIDGQTRRIAERMGAALRAEGHAVTVRAAHAPEAARDLIAHEAVVIGAAIRYGHHSPALRRLVRANREHLGRCSGAFFSVCLSAGGPGARPKVAQKYLEAFLRRTGWRPPRATSFAGALRYPRYNPLIRLLMRMIVGIAGGETDTSREYEYTDWDAVERFARDFAASLRTPG